MVLDINGEAFTVVQSGIECAYSVRPTTLDAANGGETATIQVTATSGCAWTAVASEPWLRTIPASGLGSGPLAIEIAPHNGDARTAFVDISGARLTVKQSPR